MPSEILDAFENLSGWTAITSGEARLVLVPAEGPDGKAMRLEFDFRGGGGFVVARKLFSLELPTGGRAGIALPDKPAGQPACTAQPPGGGSAGIALPESYSFGFLIRGEAPANIFEFKLVDASGQNVWRYRVEEFPVPADWRPIRIRSRQIEFAWGPLGGGPARNITALELVIAAGPGGKGAVEFAELSYRDDSYRATPAVSASSALPGFEPERVVTDGAGWRSDAAEPQWLEIDFRQEREYGGLVIEWEPRLWAREFEVQVSTDGAAWHTRYATSQAGGGRSYVYLPQTCSRYVRLNLNRSMAGRGFGIRGIEVKPFDFSRSINTFFESIARESPAGFYPKYLLGRQTYWTSVGTGEGETQALFNEEGMVEVDKGSFSIEPFLYADGKLLTWADATLAQGLEQGYLPTPWAEWRMNGLILEIGVFATPSPSKEEGAQREGPGDESRSSPPVPSDPLTSTFYPHPDPPIANGRPGKGLAGAPGQAVCDWSARTTLPPARGREGAVLYIRYRLENTRPEPQSVHFFAVVRPFQVTPTWQHWRTFGGVAEVRELVYRDGVVWVNGRKAVIPLAPATGFGAATFAEGAVTEYLASGEVPPHTELRDEFGYGSGALRFDLELAPGAAEEIYLAVPFGFEADWATVAALRPVSGPVEFEQAVQAWTSTLNTAEIRLPPTARDFADTLKTAAAHILINRDGPALHPGPRRYNRAWIRDGVLMGAALLRMGYPTALRDFMRWYAQFQAESGELPDCADREGTEWLPEFDAYGQFIYGIMEYWRFTGDTAFLREMQAAAWKALAYMESLRAQRLAAEYQTPEKRACYGLLPESMSHEGYMAHPVHAYWDDFWALRGLKDAFCLAEALGEGAEAVRLAALRDEFCRDLYASLDATIARHGIDFIPGSVEFGDFDPAATAIALAPVDEMHRLPRPAIDRTFDRFMAGFRERAAGMMAWNNYSAYEIRIVGALVRLGRRRDALELAEFLLANRRIRSWNQWPEISWRDPLGPSFIGDLPHTWISGEYILAVLSLFVYEREMDECLVLAAGVADEWLADGFGMTVENLPTWYGMLSYSLRFESGDTLRFKLWGDLKPPPGGIVVKPPLPGCIVRVEANGGRQESFDAESFTCRVIPAEVVVLIGMG